ncbi:MAG: iron-containing alcohol dehydrogenase [Halobacteria archaeon]|nr:iron-containing alcohol dehydrogenase [Halobacteria archaeon]
MISCFSLARFPRIEFGSGCIDRLPALVSSYGKHVLLVTGASSLQTSPVWERIRQDLQHAGITHEHTRVNREPSPQLIDAVVNEFSGHNIDVVLGIGGGSVLDAAKAIAGLLQVGDTVMDYLEGVGPEKPYRGPAVPFIAVPTTAGTGSEATRNAVLSVQGENGFKKSFRDEQLVPEYAVVDPDLLATCPPAQIAANGMDALTQLIESYVSTGANRVTDALALDGITAARDSLLPLYDDPAGAGHAREGMAYAALVSGITLAQTGLGSVHGLASPLGAFFPIPHGVVCGTLVASATRMNIEAMRAREPGNPALIRYRVLGELLCQQTFSTIAVAQDALVALLEDWTTHMDIPRLGQCDVTPGDFDRIIANCRGSSMRTNPIVLNDAEILKILQQRL